MPEKHDFCNLFRLMDETLGEKSVLFSKSKDIVYNKDDLLLCHLPMTLLYELKTC